MEAQLERWQWVSLTGQWQIAEDSQPSSDRLIGQLTFSIILTDRHRRRVQRSSRIGETSRLPAMTLNAGRKPDIAFTEVARDGKERVKCRVSELRKAGPDRVSVFLSKCSYEATLSRPSKFEGGAVGVPGTIILGWRGDKQANSLSTSRAGCRRSRRSRRSRRVCREGLNTARVRGQAM